MYNYGSYWCRHSVWYMHAHTCMCGMTLPCIARTLYKLVMGFKKGVVIRHNNDPTRHYYRPHWKQHSAFDCLQITLRICQETTLNMTKCNVTVTMVLKRTHVLYEHAFSEARTCIQWSANSYKEDSIDTCVVWPPLKLNYRIICQQSWVKPEPFSAVQPNSGLMIPFFTVYVLK